MDREFKLFPEYFVFSEVELFSLILCLLLDISEYMAAILILPIIGDMLDIVGIVACLLMFRWVGIVSLLELVPGADILPIFIITWLAWYLLKKTKKVEHERLHKKITMLTRAPINPEEIISTEVELETELAEVKRQLKDLLKEVKSLRKKRRN